MKAALRTGLASRLVETAATTALVAMALPAAAQSSVTITGAMDVGAPRHAMGYRLKVGQTVAYFPRTFSPRSE